MPITLQTLTCTELLCGEQRFIHTVLSGGGAKTFPHHKPGRNNKGTLQLSGSQTSCQPHLAPPHAHLETAGPCTGCLTHESAGQAATSSYKYLFSWSSFTYQPSRLYILPCWSKSTGLAGSFIHELAKPVFFGGGIEYVFLQQWISC